ncbi:MAG: M23 family metallopeptidase [Acidobacteriota bacterium]
MSTSSSSPFRQPWRVWLTFLILALLSVPLLADPPISVDVEIDRVAPLKDGDLVYMRMAGLQFGDSTTGRLAVDLFLQNNENFPVTIDEVRIDFFDPVMPPRILSAGLGMRCPFPGNSLLITQADGLDLPANTLCRLVLTSDPVLALPAPAQAQITVSFVGIQNTLADQVRDLVSHQSTGAPQGYLFPAKSQDLAPGEFWSAGSTGPTSNHRSGASNDDMVFAYDMIVRRWDSGTSQWLQSHPPDPGEVDPLDTNEDYLIWGKPIYAMADGVVTNCNSGFPDDLIDQDMGDTANSFTIQHGNELASYVHLRNGSVNQSICFPGAMVEAGEFLGEVGNSGLSSFPHLHLQVTRNGDPMPLQFRDAFVIERDNAFVDPPSGNSPWFPMLGHGYTWTGTATWPGPMIRRGDRSIGYQVVETEIALPRLSRPLTASRRDNGDLLVLSWDLDSDAEFTPVGIDGGGQVGEMALTVPNGTQDAALALITGGGSLKLIAYDVETNNPTLARTAEHTSNPVTGVAASPGPFNDGVLTLIRTQFGNHKVIAWRVDPEAGVIQRRGEEPGGAVDALAITNTFAFPGAVTAVQTNTNHLELSTIEVQNNGWALNRIDTYTDDAIEDVDIARVGYTPNFQDLVVTASRTSGGSLELISWAIHPAGAITRLDDISAGTVGEVELAVMSDQHVVTSVTDAGGELKLIAWHVAGDGTFTRRGEIEAGAASGIAQSDLNSNFGFIPATTVSAMTETSGDIKLIAWQVELND